MRPGWLLSLLLLLTPASHAEVTPRLEGLDDDLAQRLLKRVDPSQLECDTPRWMVRAWLRDLQSETERALRARSHYTPEFESALLRQEDCWQPTLRVTPGPITRLRDVSIEVTGPGADSETFTKPLREHRIKPEQPFNEGDYEALKQALRRSALESGYFDARFEQARVDVWPDEQAADVELTFVTGIHYQFGEIRVNAEPAALSDRTLNELVELQTGTPYSRLEVERLRRRLLQAGYFEAVDVVPDIEGRSGQAIDVDVALDMRPQHEVSGGIGFATDFGPRLRANYDNRYLNRHGHRASARFNLSPVLQELQGDYSMPLRGETDGWLIFDAAVQHEKTDTAETLMQSLGARRVRSGPWGTRLTESLHLQREDFDVASDDDVAWLVMPGVALSKTRQYQSRPLEIGWRLDAQLRGATEPISTTSFTQLYLRAAGAIPLGDKARMLARVEVGTTWADALADLPTSVRFFAGGDRSIRGYALDNLGPTDADGEVRGGRHLLVTSIELERLVSGNWSVAVFADTGGAFNKSREPWSTGAGLGVRWQSPVGPIRLDLASPLDDNDRYVRLHLGVGSTFQ